MLANQLSALTSTTTLVSITIGGNDENFSSIMEDCNLDGDEHLRQRDQRRRGRRRRHPARQARDTLFADQSRAPNAEVVVLDYPHFYDLAKAASG